MSLISEFSLRHVLLLVYICAFTEQETRLSKQIPPLSCCKHFPHGLFPVCGLSGGHSPSLVTVLGFNFINYFLKFTALTLCKIPADCLLGSFSAGLCSPRMANLTPASCCWIQNSGLELTVVKMGDSMRTRTTWTLRSWQWEV